MRRKPPSAHGAASLLRLFFPHTRARVRSELSKLRHKTLPALKHRAQSRIYRHLVSRQTKKLPQPNLLQRLRGATGKVLGRPSGGCLENEARVRRRNLAASTESTESTAGTKESDGMSSMGSYAGGESGGRRRKLAGYLKAANELRQTYTQQYAPNWSSREAHYDYEDDTPGSFPDAAIVRSGDEEMILFPSYARKHIKRKPEAVPGTIQETAGDGRDVRDSTGAGDAEFWKQQWDNYEDDNAVVDVDVRGWIYSPHKGQMTRKQRLFIGLARQLVGVSAPPAGAGASAAASASNSSANSRDPSPNHVGFRERAQLRQSQRDENMAAREAEEILRKGEREAAAAAKGAYSEKPSRSNQDDTQLYRTQSGDSVRTAGSTRAHQLAHSQSKDSLRSDDEHITPLQKRASWNQPADMSPAELAEANARLMARLRHFLAMPMANTPISVFFYNDNISKQRTIYTNAAGHFSMTAALDFVPTHVRILASEQLSATEEVIITDSKGISVISDIDDTIKHSAISSGAREIFRNVFIRDLSDLTIDGVKEWYNDMSKMGVKFHYVSNSPWQLYPVISTYFSMAGLPPGSFHLKQYSGMMQGIFEPVAERKKITLDKISRDFPERRFILIGDSGEADLEVYTDFVLENPGRVAAVFIRDVTTTETGGFFDPSVGPMSGSSSPRRSAGSNASDIASPASATRALTEEHDPELRAAIAASLRAFEEEDKKRSNPQLPHNNQDHPNNRPGLPARQTIQTTKEEPVANLIDLSSSDDEGPETIPSMRRANTDTEAFKGPSRTSTSSSIGKAAPLPPKKPTALRSPSNDSLYASPSPTSTSKAPPPPKPRRPSTTIRMVGQPSPLSQQSDAPTSPPSNRPAPPQPNYSTKPQYDRSNQSYAGMARDKLYSVYNNLPAWSPEDQQASDNASIRSGSDGSSTRKTAPPPPPPRRNPAGAAASYVGGKASSAWQHAPSLPHRPQMTSTQTSAPFSTTAQREKLNRTSTGSTLGLNGGGQGQTADGQYVNKREAMWRQRWARAEQVLSEQGVVLRSWRVGTDLMAEAERIVKANEKENRIGNKNGARASVNERSIGEGSLRRKPGR
jgi:phosphatidate phosphatase APP1